MQLQTQDFGETVINILEATAHSSYLRYFENGRLKNMIDKYKHFWQKFHTNTLDATNIDDANDISSRIIKKLCNRLTKYIEFLNESIFNLIDIGLKTWQNLLKRNDNFKLNTLNLLENDFVHSNNKLIHEATNNINDGIPNAIESVCQNTTQNQYKYWRRKV